MGKGQQKQTKGKQAKKKGAERGKNEYKTGTLQNSGQGKKTLRAKAMPLGHKKPIYF